jgi:hypothetical protein
MSSAPLTRKGFKAWLFAKEQDGRIFLSADCFRCPLAWYLKETHGTRASVRISYYYVGRRNSHLSTQHRVFERFM